MFNFHWKIIRHVKKQENSIYNQEKYQSLKEIQKGHILWLIQNNVKISIIIMHKNLKKNVYTLKKEMKDVKQTPKMELLIV